VANDFTKVKGADTDLNPLANLGVSTL